MIVSLFLLHMLPANAFSAFFFHARSPMMLVCAPNINCDPLNHQMWPWEVLLISLVIKLCLLLQLLKFLTKWMEDVLQYYMHSDQNIDCVIIRWNFDVWLVFSIDDILYRSLEENWKNLWKLSRSLIDGRCQNKIKALWIWKYLLERK